MNIRYGDLINYIISPSGDIDVFRFEASAGEKIFLTQIFKCTNFSTYQNINHKMVRSSHFPRKPRILPVDVSILCAKPSPNKSWLALDFAMAIAIGTSKALDCKQAIKRDALVFFSFFYNFDIDQFINFIFLVYFHFWSEMTL